MKAPESPPALLPGRTAWGWMRIGVASLLACAPMLALIWFAAGLPDPLKNLAMLGILVVVFGLSAAGLSGFINALRTGLRERQAGYTTLYGAMIDSWQLDHRTGEVLRMPGERQVRRRPPRGGS